LKDYNPNDYERQKREDPMQAYVDHSNRFDITIVIQKYIHVHIYTILGINMYTLYIIHPYYACMYVVCMYEYYIYTVAIRMYVCI